MLHYSPGCALSALAVSDNGTFVATGTMSEVSAYGWLSLSLSLSLSLVSNVMKASSFA